MDCGSGVVHRMAQLGLDWAAVTHLALTHFDADHVSDVATFFVALRWGQLPPRAEPLDVIGPPGTQALLERLAAALWDKLLTPGFEVRVHELAPGGDFDLGDGVWLAAHKVPHTVESVAYSVERRGARVVYTGDTSYDESLARWAAGCQLLLCECSLPANMAVASHMTPEACGRLAALASPAHLALTHFYPPVERVDVAAAVALAYGGPMTLAHDGWTYEIEEIAEIEGE
jgi:ribonuclease BN (tRNA processing enzyme)